MTFLTIKNNAQFKKDFDRFKEVIDQLDGDKKAQAEKLFRRFTDAVKRIDDTLENVAWAPINYSFHVDARAELNKLRVDLENLLPK
jgi:hypothetical protein